MKRFSMTEHIEHIGRIEREAARQKMQHVLVPMLEQIYGKYDRNAPKEVDIDMDNNLLINGTPVGDWRLTSRFETHGPILSFKYDRADTRMVLFGTDPFDLSTCHKVYGVYEFGYGSSQTKTIYEHGQVPGQDPPKPLRGAHL